MAKHVQARLPDEVVEWFESQFPMRGSKQWFIEQCFKQLILRFPDPEVRDIPEEVMAWVERLSDERNLTPTGTEG